jgi:hypothetical protein
MLANQQSSSSDLFTTLPDSMNTPELNVPMAEGEPKLYMEKLLNGAHFENARIAPQHRDIDQAARPTISQELGHDRDFNFSKPRASSAWTLAHHPQYPGSALPQWSCNPVLLPALRHPA